MWQLGGGAVAAAAWRRRWQLGGGSTAVVAEVAAVCGDGGGDGGSDGSLAAAAEALRRRLGTVVAAAEAAWQQQLRGIGSATSAAVMAARQRDCGCGGCGNSFPPTHTPSNTTDTPTCAPLSLVEDGGTTVLIASLSAHGDIHRGRRGADEAKSDADNTIC